MREVIARDSDLYRAVYGVLEAFREECCPKDWRILAFDLARDGPDLILTVHDETFASRELRGRLSGFMLLCGRYFGSTLSEATYSKAPVFLRRIENAPAVETRARDSLIVASLYMDRSGEREEAVFILRRAVLGCKYDRYSGSATIGHAIPAEASPALVKAVLQTSELPGLFGAQKSWNVLRAMKVVIPRFRHSDSLERAVAVTAAEDVLRGASWNASRRFPQLAEMTVPSLCGLASDQNAFIQERALVGLEVIGKRLFLSVKVDWRYLLPAVESLLASGVYTEWQLERRFACRLWSGDDGGARQDMQARLELGETPPTREFFEREIRARGRPLAEGPMPSQSLRHPSTSSTSTTTHGELAAPLESPPAAKPRGKRQRIDPIDPAEFVALMVRSIREDLVRASLAGPRASEPCLKLTISIAGVPRSGPLYGFSGPVYTLRRVSDVSHALDIYRRLGHVYVAKKRPKALVDLVAKIAEEQADDRRFIWFMVRDIFDDPTGRERKRFERAIAQQAAGNLSYAELPFGAQRYRAQGGRAERLVGLFEQAFASGMGPALGKAVFDTLPQDLNGDEVWQPLPRAPGFKAVLSLMTTLSIGERRDVEFAIE
ncbi:MAG TPA: hypothetical protein VKB87_03870 [Myxococcaceae bacterium]|nr:hypothetical protein [Myxococcaceae bacterium]